MTHNKPFDALPENSPDFAHNELVFRQSLLDTGITSETISRAKAQLVPPPASQIEEHVRLYELLDVYSIIKERHLENSHATDTYKSVMTLYLRAIPELVPHERWN